MRATILIFLAACGSPDAPASQSPAQDACSQYLSCVYAAAPEQAAGASAAYGSDGACWKTESHDVCIQGCSSGLKALHALSPAACPLCFSDADCSAGSPACDANRGECVGCTSNDYCSGIVCDQLSQHCVQCAADGDCPSNLPACDTSQHVCVACNDGSQCRSHRCDNGSCCVPKPPCYPGFSCGSLDDGCGNAVNCGSCSVGTCSGAVCTSEGMPCTPGPNACPPRERCMFDGISKGYLCHDPDDLGFFSAATACVVIGDPYCEGSGLQYDDPHYYVCSPDTTGAPCIQMCLTASDCIQGGACSPYFDKTIISAAKPGYCHS